MSIHFAPAPTPAHKKSDEEMVLTVSPTIHSGIADDFVYAEDFIYFEQQHS